MPIIQATPNLKLEKPEANHAAWERAYWRLATLVDLWLTQIARGHYVLSGGHLTLTAGHIDLDATSVQFVGTAASFALGAQTAIAALVADDTYVVYVDNAGALQVSTLTPALLWSGALPSNFVLLGAVFEVEGVWTIHNRPLATGRGALGGIAGLNGAGHVPDAQLAAVIHGMDFTGAGGAAQQLYPGGWVYNLYYDGGWKYFGNGFGFALNVDTGTGRIVVSLAPNNAGGAGAAAAPVTLGTFEQDGKFHASQDAANIVSGVIDDARIPAAITRDSELAAEAALARNADNLTGGTVADARIAASIARDSEVTAAVAAEAALARNAGNLTGGTIADARLASVVHNIDLTAMGLAVQNIGPSLFAYNLYYLGGWNYVQNGYGAMIRIDGGLGRLEIWVAPNNVAGAGAAAVPTIIAAFEQDGKLHSSADASLISSGVLAVARIPSLDTAQITTGGFDASRITTGTFSQVRIGAAAVGQGQLKTSTGFVSVYNTSNNLILAGGQYGFYPYLSRDATGTGGESRHLNIGNASFTDVTYIYLSNGGANLYASQRYIQASPPYDLGDGEIPLFVFALVEADGRISSVYTAPDPPWANNGPTNIRPDCWIGGKSHQARCIVLPKPAPDAPANAWEAWADSMAAQPTHELIEVTQAIKQADMPLIPHPFLGNDLSGRTVVLLDPVSPLTERLLLLHEAGESINALLHEDYLRVDNSAILRKAPPGVISCAARWKNSK
jgi:hypothetical protein